MTQRVWFGLPLMVALGVGCTDDDTSVERRGGPLPSDGGSGASAGGPTVEPQGGGGGEGPIAFCDAFAVIEAKCQRCHQDPLQNGAPTPFLNYEDTQAQYFDSNLRWWEVMQGAVDRDFMPYVDLNNGPSPIMPPVEPLTADEKATLLGWLNQGALPVGGTDCP